MKEPGFGWYGAGYACMKGEEVTDMLMPPLDDEQGLFRWLDGFAAAHADYPDDEAIDSMLFGDGMGGESFDDALFRILKFEIYDKLESSGGLEKYQNFLESRTDWTRRRAV